MRVQPRALLVGAFALGPVLLFAGCGSQADGARNTIVNIQPSSYVVQEPATTTTVPVTVPPEEGGTSAAEQTYIVVAGDSVYKIAEKHDIEPEALANYNSWADGVSHPVFVGDEVKIPPGSTVAATATPGVDSGDEPDGGDAADASEDASSEGGCQHTIVAGENPSRVANDYDITVEQLQVANSGNPAMTQFVVGQVLTIPPDGDC